MWVAAMIVMVAASPVAFDSDGTCVGKDCIEPISVLQNRQNMFGQDNASDPVIMLQTKLVTADIQLQQVPADTFHAWDEAHVTVTCRGIDASEALLEVEKEEVKSETETDPGLAGRCIGDPNFDPTANPYKFARFNPEYIFTFKHKGWQMPYYGSVDIEKAIPNTAKLAFLTFHGALRNAQDYFCSAERIIRARPSQDLKQEDILVMAFKFHYQMDADFHSNLTNATGLLWWNGSKPLGDYRVGGSADPEVDDTVDSFEVLDDVILYLNNKDLFPNLKTILIVGHSAGGQTVARYSLISHLIPSSMATSETYQAGKSVRPGVKVRYMIGNPSSWTYLNDKRWSYAWDGKSGWTSQKLKTYQKKRGRSGWSSKAGNRRRGCGLDSSIDAWGESKFFEDGVDPQRTHRRRRRFICRTSRSNSWPYGVDVKAGPVVPYLRNHPRIDTWVQEWAQRDVILVVGQNDTCTDDMLPERHCSPSCWKRENGGCYRNTMDIRCQAMLQGPNRNVRAVNYMKHVEDHYGRPVHKLIEVHNVGHQAEHLFSDPAVASAMWAM